MSVILSPKIEHRIISDNLLSWVESWVSDLKLSDKKPRTIEFYITNLKPFIIYISSREIESVDQITTDILRDYFAYIKPKHNDGGLHAVYRSLKVFFRWYGEEIDLPYQDNPIRKIKIKNPSPDKLDPYTVDEINRLLSVSTNNLIATSMILFLYDTGIRINEMLSVKIKDYNQITGDVYLPDAITKNGEKRTVHVSQRTRRTLRKYLLSRSDDCPYLFITEHKSKFSYDGARDIFEVIFSRANVEYHGFHGFRRAWFNSMALSGQNIYGLRLLGGWKDVKTPERYMKILEKDIARLSVTHSPVDDL